MKEINQKLATGRDWVSTKLNLIPGPVYIYLVYIVGLIGHLRSETLVFFLQITPGFLGLIGLISIWLSMRSANNKRYFALWIVATAVFTFACEVIGVKTGLIFGNYDYGAILGPKIFEVPPVIALNWVLVALGAYELIRDRINSDILQILVAAALTVAFDYVLEPVAIQLGYWTWVTVDGAPPTSNYISWFAISLITLSLYKQLGLEIKNRLVRHLFVAQALFFWIL